MPEAYFGTAGDPEEARARRLAQIEALRARQAEDSFVRNMARRGGRTLTAAGRQFGQDVVDAHGNIVGEIEGNMPPLAALRALTTPEPRAETEATQAPWYGPTGDPGGAVLAMAAGAPLGKKAPNPEMLAALRRFKTTTPGRIVNETLGEGGGYSVNLPTGTRPTEGVMVGKFANTDPRNLVIPGDQRLTRADVLAHITRNPTLMREENYLGTWRDPDTGEIFLDVSRRFEPGAKGVRQASKFGERTQQRSVYDVGKKQTLPISDWRNYITGPEFHGRMDELAQEGRQYLEQFPTKEWWDMHGDTAFERVYGRENLPQVAGFTATTAPNTAPIANLQTMSEYMRRHLKGEPIIQPDWRVPEGTMSRQAGKKIGMEKGRRANLVKASQGRLDELREDKVREEAAAMMGDPNAFVGDRWWARVAEDPAQGVYTGVKEGMLPPGAPYQALKAEVAKGAARAGRASRDYSADIWTGIRERVRATKQLYGRRYAGNIDESKSYNDHLEDLLDRKSQHLGISKPELEKRLRAGDETLLAWAAATPLLAPLFAELGGERAEVQ